MRQILGAGLLPSFRLIYNHHQGSRQDFWDHGSALSSSIMKCLSLFLFFHYLQISLQRSNYNCIQLGVKYVDTCTNDLTCAINRIYIPRTKNERKICLLWKMVSQGQLCIIKSRKFRNSGRFELGSHYVQPIIASLNSS